MPPEAIHDVMNGVLRIFKNYDSSWNSMQRFLKQQGVIQSILQFNPRQITEDIRMDLDKFMADHYNSFEKAVIYKASLAAGPLGDWVKAILKYSKVLEKIEPLEKRLNKVEDELKGQRMRLRECED